MSRWARSSSTGFGRTVSAANVDYLLANKLTPLDLVAGGAAEDRRDPSVLTLKLRGTLIPASGVQRIARLFAPLPTSGLFDEFDRKVDRLLTERCIMFGASGPPMLPEPYNNNYQIVQGPGYVMILVEMVHDARVIPLDNHPHLPKGVQQWMGDSRGHWEGNTLVVDTTNFTDKTKFRGADENLHLTERFTRIAPDTIRYEFTMDDPTAFTQVWKAEVPMIRSDPFIYEHACNEGNYGLTGILGGARADERNRQK